MRCTQPTTTFTGRQATSPTATNTFSVGFGKRTVAADGVDGPATTQRDLGYSHP